MYKLFSIVVFAFAMAHVSVVPAVGAMPADDKPKKNKEEPKKGWKVLKAKADAKTKAEQEAAARAGVKWKAPAKTPVAGQGNGMTVNPSETVHITLTQDAIKGPVTVRSPWKDKAKTEEGKKVPKPARKNWQVVTPAEEAEANELIQEILSKWNRTELFSGDFKNERASGQLKSDPDGKNWEYIFLTNSEGTYDLKNDGGKTSVRLEIQVGGSYMTIDDSQKKLYHIINWVYGGHLYTLKTWEETHVAEKHDQRSDGMMTLGGEHFFEDLKRLYKLRVGKTKESLKLDGHDVWIIEGVTKPGGENANLAIHAFDKESGVLIKLATYDNRRRPQMSITLENLNLHPDFPAGHFTFSAPQGVHLRDLTKNTSSATGE